MERGVKEWMNDKLCNIQLQARSETCDADLSASSGAAVGDARIDICGGGRHFCVTLQPNLDQHPETSELLRLVGNGFFITSWYYQSLKGIVTVKHKLKIFLLFHSTFERKRSSMFDKGYNFVKNRIDFRQYEVVIGSHSSKIKLQKRCFFQIHLSLYEAAWTVF